MPCPRSGRPASSSWSGSANPMLRALPGRVAAQTEGGRGGGPATGLWADPRRTPRAAGPPPAAPVSSPASTAARTSAWTAFTPAECRSRWSSSSRTSAQVKSSCCWARFVGQSVVAEVARDGRGPAARRRRRRRRGARAGDDRGRPLRPWPRTRRSAPARSRAAALASCSRSPSALLTAITSAISRMPFLMPWSWSPVRARVRNRNVSTMPATVTSDCPTPTVSTSTTSYARRLEHRHRLRRSPGRRRRGCRPTGDGRMKACGSSRAGPSGSCRRAPSRRCGRWTGRRRARRPGGRRRSAGCRAPR